MRLRLQDQLQPPDQQRPHPVVRCAMQHVHDRAAGRGAALLQLASWQRRRGRERQQQAQRGLRHIISYHIMGGAAFAGGWCVCVCVVGGWGMPNMEQEMPCTIIQKASSTLVLLLSWQPQHTMPHHTTKKRTAS